MTSIVPDELGHFGPFGGRFVPEALMAALDEIDPTIIVIGEGWNMGTHPSEIRSNQSPLRIKPVPHGTRDSNRESGAEDRGAVRSRRDASPGCCRDSIPATGRTLRP